MKTPGMAATPAAAILEASVTALEWWESKNLSIDDFLESDAALQEYRRSIAGTVFLYFRNKLFVDRLLKRRLVQRPRQELLHILRIALTQALFSTSIAPEVAVSVAVDAAEMKSGKGAAGLVNAVLRRILEEAPRLIIEPKNVLPKPIFHRWKQLMPKKINLMAGEFMSTPAFTCRDTGDFRLDAGKFKAEPVELEFTAPYRFYRIGEPGKLLDSNELNNGEIYIQDPATALPVSMLELNGDEKVCDLCAAPGGKTLMIAEKLSGRGFLLVNDRSARRQEQTRANFDRLKVTIPYEISVADALDVRGEFDVVVCDVPCSNTGVFRRRPDALWRFTEEHLKELTALQMKILGHAAKLVKPGGRLLYSTCSIDPDENGLLVAEFLKSHGLFSLIKQRQCYPDRYCDGAYTALMIRNIQ